MRRTLVRAAALAAPLVLVVACRKPTSVTADVPTAASAEAGRPAASAVSAAALTHTTGPAPATASRADRESAVLGLVLGGGATSLPEVSTDPEKGFNYNLRDKIAPRTPVTIRMTKLDVVGELQREVVQRILRHHIGTVRVCYERALDAKPSLGGTLVLAFTIDTDGSVKNAKDGGSTVGDAGMVECAVRAYTRVTFPRPEKGTVQVTYRLELKPPS